MKESLLLFDEICNSRWFVDTPIVLFLNKTDIFKDKLQKNDLSVAFKDYGEGNDFQKAFDFISKKYTGRCRNIDKKIHVYGTCATDKDQLSKVFESVTNLFTQ
jgi:guanine nucleotide-binding protein G(i) subunit alpha